MKFYKNGLPWSAGTPTLNPRPAKGDTARLAKWARMQARRCMDAAECEQWWAIADEAGDYAARFEQGTLFAEEVAA